MTLWAYQPEGTDQPNTLFPRKFPETRTPIQCFISNGISRKIDSAQLHVQSCVFFKNGHRNHLSYLVPTVVVKPSTFGFCSSMCLIPRERESDCVHDKGDRRERTTPSLGAGWSLVATDVGRCTSSVAGRASVPAILHDHRRTEVWDYEPVLVPYSASAGEMPSNPRPSGPRLTANIELRR